MIKIEWHRLFYRYYRKLSVKQKEILQERIKLFETNPRHPFLKVHRLTGNLSGFYSFSLGGDFRLIFEWPTKNCIVLHKIGTHNQVY